MSGDGWRGFGQRAGMVWEQGWRHADRRRSAILRGLAAVVFVASVTLLLSWQAFVPGGAASLSVGDIVTEDVRSPYSLTYASSLLTEQARSQARLSVGSIYDPPDPGVSRQQSALLQQILLYIDDVRLDIYATPEQKAADLGQIAALNLSESARLTLASLDEPTWKLAALEAQAILERVMRDTVREQDLPQVITTLPTQVSVRFTPEQSAAISSLVQDLIRPNSLINMVATDTAREMAVAAVEPINRTFERGQVIVRAGERIDELDSEALDQLGLLDAPNVQVQAIIRGVASALLMVFIIALYLRRVQPDMLEDLQRLWVLEAILLLTLLMVRLITLTGQIVFAPAAVIGMVYLSLTTPMTAVFATFIVGLLSALMVENSLEAALYISMGGVIGALLMRSTDRITRYFFVGLVIGLSNAVVFIIFRVNLVLVGQAGELGVLLIAGLVMGLVTAIAALAIVYLLTIVLNLPTSLRLIELSQPNHPLLQRLLREAPGTYQHSLQVANLSEQAANAVGANSELVRVAAMYHDVGKMMNPVFFIENQAEQINPHDTLDDPYRSASIIISHVPDGGRLARQYRLPGRLHDFIWQHHGTTRVGYFYNKALEQAGDADSVDSTAFTYPGPRPQTRETAIVMLADSSESTVRARKPASRDEIAEIVQEIIDARMAEGQLDECDLTLRDVRAIHRVFVEVLQGVFHPRINYPAVNGHAAQTPPEITGTASIAAGEPPLPLAAEDDTPLADVPLLKRSKAAGSGEGDKTARDEETAISSVRGADE